MLWMADRREAGGIYLLVGIPDADSGIPVELEDKIFNPFVTPPKARGSDLGLAIRSSFADAHGERPATIHT